MTQARFRDDGRRIDDFLDHVLVVCPRCGARAEVRPVPGQTVASSHWSAPRRLTCAHCGLTRTRTKPSVGFGRAVDPYFALPLALQAPCAGETIWAYNGEHLDHLLAFAAAIVRERPHRTPENPARSTSLLEKMPSWFGAAENRDAVTAALRKLRSTLT